MPPPPSTNPANRQRARASRLSDRQLLRLMSYLHAPERSPSVMPIDAAHGTICAAACAPIAIPAARWLSAILGDGHVFPSAEIEDEITALLLQLHESTSFELRQGPRLALLANSSLTGPEQFRDWAEGYLVGVALSEPPWHELVLADGDFAWMMFPFFALAGRQQEIESELGIRQISGKERSRLLREITACLGTHLVMIYDYWARAMRGRGLH